MKRPLLVSLIAVASIVPFARGAAEQDSKDIQGTWVPLSAELGGQKFPEQVLKMTKLVMSDGKYLVTVGDSPDEGTVKLDPAKTPKAIDINGTKGPNMGKFIPAIYELKDDTLRICYNLGGKERPEEFATKEGGKLYLVTYKRMK